MSVDWSQFRNKDRVRLVFEGEWRTADESATITGGFRPDGASPHCWIFLPGWIELATSADLVERPFTPPAAGTLFRNESLWISLGDAGFRLVRRWDDELPRPGMGEDRPRPWSAMASEWLADIEVIAGV